MPKCSDNYKTGSGKIFSLISNFSQASGDHHVELGEVSLELNNNFLG